MSAKDHLSPEQFLLRRKKQLDDEAAEEQARQESMSRHPAGTGKDDSSGQPPSH